MNTFLVGDRCEVHPATNAWIFGDRCGEIVKFGRKYVHVRMDRSGRTLRFVPDHIWRIIRCEDGRWTERIVGGN